MSEDVFNPMACFLNPDRIEETIKFMKSIKSNELPDNNGQYYRDYTSLEKDLHDRTLKLAEAVKKEKQGYQLTPTEYKHFRAEFDVLPAVARAVRVARERRNSKVEE